MHITSVVRLRIAPYTVPNGLMIDKWLNNNSQLTPSPHHSTLPHLMNNTQMADIYPSKSTCLDSSWIIKNHPKHFTIMLLNISLYTPRIFSTASSCSINHSTYINMNTTDYWPMAREYSVWNAAVAALQFWMADLNAHILSSTIDKVFIAFSYTTSTQLLCQQSDEILFSHFVTTLNAIFESKFASKDDGYESGSKNFNIPTPIPKTSRIHHISSIENASFNPVPVTPSSTRDPWLRPVCRRLTFRPSDDDDTMEDEVSLPYSMPQAQHHATDTCELSFKHNLDAHINLEEEGEDFQTVSLDDEHWTTKEIPDRPLCVHEHLIPHGLCPYPCPYANYQTPSYY